MKPLGNIVVYYGPLWYMTGFMSMVPESSSTPPNTSLEVDADPLLLCLSTQEYMVSASPRRGHACLCSPLIDP